MPHTTSFTTGDPATGNATIENRPASEPERDASCAVVEHGAQPTLLERQRELLALRTTGASVVESLNGRYTAYMKADLEKLQVISARLADEFSDLNGKGFADELFSQLAVKPPGA